MRIEVPKTEVWDVTGHTDPPRVIVRLGSNCPIEYMGPDIHAKCPEPVREAARQEWERVRPLGKNEWRDKDGDVAEFRRNPETLLPEFRWIYAGGGAWNALRNTSVVGELRAALLDWAHKNPAKAESDVIKHRDWAGRAKWLGDLIGVEANAGGVISPHDVEWWFDSARCSVLRTKLRAWIAQTRPEMLPSEGAKPKHIPASTVESLQREVDALRAEVERLTVHSQVHDG